MRTRIGVLSFARHMSLLPARYTSVASLPVAARPRLWLTVQKPLSFDRSAIGKVRYSGTIHGEKNEDPFRSSSPYRNMKAQNIAESKAGSLHFMNQPKSAYTDTADGPSRYQEEAKHTLPHPVWSPEKLAGVQITHLPPRGIRDRLAYSAVKTLRFGFDVMSGYAFGRIDEGGWLTRIAFLETVAGVPGMIGAMVRHLHSLRKMQRDYGWIHTLLEEAENERMHLMTALVLKKPTVLFRTGVLLTQGGFLLAFTTSYLLSRRFAHRFVGYLEEEAVITYTKLLKEIDQGHLPLFENLPAPPVARDYWCLEDDAPFRDVILAMRADESHHREVNHTFADMPHNFGTLFTILLCTTFTYTHGLPYTHADPLMYTQRPCFLFFFSNINTFFDMMAAAVNEEVSSNSCNYCSASKPFIPSHSPFDSQSAGISVADYVQRLKTYMRCSDSCFVMAGVYLHRFFRATAGTGVTCYTIHRLLLICVVVAAKYIDDVFYPNSHYATVGCVSLRNLNQMEKHFLEILDYKTHISEDEFDLQVQYQRQALANPENTLRARTIPPELLRCGPLVRRPKVDMQRSYSVATTAYSTARQSSAVSTAASSPCPTAVHMTTKWQQATAAC